MNKFIVELYKRGVKLVSWVIKTEDVDDTIKYIKQENQYDSIPDTVILVRRITKSKESQ
jgi:hypothetical protein